MRKRNKHKVKFKQLTESDIIKIEVLLGENKTQMEIAIKLGKNKSTISRCINNNSDEDWIFRADSAWEKICERRRNGKSHVRIVEDSFLEDYILDKIQSFWTPEQIAWRRNLETYEPLCHETIYQYVYNNKPELVRLYFRRKGKKYQHNRKEKYQMADCRSIHERPEEVKEKKEIGHWEGDTIIGKNHKQAILTNVERKSWFLKAQKTGNKEAENIADITEDMYKDEPDSIKISITYDRGTEFAWHKMIEQTTKLTVYFADPHSPFQKGAIENVNGLLRQFIPKGTDFSTVTDEDLARYVDLINNRPRKRLGWLTPLEVLQKELKSKVAITDRI